jgi:hypothetical protein
MKPKLTPELQEEIIAQIKIGNYHHVACASVGISKGTFYRWLEKGEAMSEGIYRDFYDAIKKAEHRSESSALVRLRGDESWQSEAWFLERRFPDRWGRKDSLNANMTGNLDVKFIPIKELSEEEWNQQNTEEKSK